jgi:hypothetical protein
VVVVLLPVEEEEGLVGAIVEARDQDRPGEGEPVFVAALAAAADVVSIVGPTIGVEFVIPQVVIGAAMIGIAAGAAGGDDDTAGGAAVFG